MRWPQQGVEISNPELKDKFSREQPMASGQKRRWESGARQFLAMTALQLRTHLAHDGGVIEGFSTDASVSLAVLSDGGRATQPHDGGLGNFEGRRSNCLMSEAGNLGWFSPTSLIGHQKYLSSLGIWFKGNARKDGMFS